MTIRADAVALVTGANGERRAWRTIREASSRTRYAQGVRDSTYTENPCLDRERAAAVTILLNNAGISLPNSSLLSGSDEELRLVLDTNLVGQIRMVRAFADALASSAGRDGVIDMHSALS